MAWRAHWGWGSGGGRWSQAPWSPHTSQWWTTTLQTLQPGIVRGSLNYLKFSWFYQFLPDNFRVSLEIPILSVTTSSQSSGIKSYRLDCSQLQIDWGTLLGLNAECSYCQATGTGTWDLGPGTWDLGPGSRIENRETRIEKRESRIETIPSPSADSKISWATHPPTTPQLLKVKETSYNKVPFFKNVLGWSPWPIQHKKWPVGQQE